MAIDEAVIEYAKLNLGDLIMVITKGYQDIKPVLMEPGRNYIREPYYVIKSNGQVIYVVSSGLNGTEFNKTEGFFSNYPAVLHYGCLFGQGILLMQRNDDLGDAKEFKVITLNSGKQVDVPSTWGFCLINTGKNLLVVLGSKDLGKQEIDSKPIYKKSGLAYYVIERRGEISFEANPNYSVHPQITTE